MSSVKDDRRKIQRFMGWSALILLTPWVLIAGLKVVQSFQDGVLANSGLQVALIGVIAVVFGALMMWVIPTWKARRASRGQ